MRNIQLRGIVSRKGAAHLPLLLTMLLALWPATARTAYGQADRTTTADTTACTHLVALDTSLGRIVLKLYDDTPLHRDNFIKLVREGWYNGLLFHRVIPNFMVQAGDSASRHAQPGQLLGDSPESYSIPAEIRYPAHFHRKGALAAAREGDDVNPQRASSASQFYIVTGRPYTENMLDQVQQRLDERSDGRVKLTPEIRQVYETEGGAPHLDGQYTVFGEVVEGMNVAEQIQWAERDENDRPLSDIRILKATVIK